MKFAHNIRISVFCYEDDDSEKIKEKMRGLVPFDLEKEKITISVTNATGFFEKRIMILELRLDKDRHINEFLCNLKSHLTEEQKNLILRQLNSRVDDNCLFFLRLDKESLLENRYLITTSGSCFHIKIHVASFPKKKAAALEKIGGFLMNQWKTI